MADNFNLKNGSGDVIRNTQWLSNLKIHYELNGGYCKRTDSSKYLDIKPSSAIRFVSRADYNVNAYLQNDHLDRFKFKLIKLHRKCDQVYFIFDDDMTQSLYRKSDGGYNETPNSEIINKLKFKLQYKSYGKDHEISVIFIVDMDRVEKFQLALDDNVFDLTKDEFEFMIALFESINPMIDSLFVRGMDGNSMGSYYKSNRYDNNPNDSADIFVATQNEKTNILPKAKSFFDTARAKQTPIDMGSMGKIDSPKNKRKFKGIIKREKML